MVTKWALNKGSQRTFDPGVLEALCRHNCSKFDVFTRGPMYGIQKVQAPGGTGSCTENLYIRIDCGCTKRFACVIRLLVL